MNKLLSELLKCSLREEFNILILIVISKILEDLPESILYIEVALDVRVHLLYCLGDIHSNIRYWVLLKSNNYW